MIASPGGPVVACIDGSRYLASVCDHAAALAARLRVGVELLHVEEPTEAAPARRARPHGRGAETRCGDPVVQDAAARLSDNGAELADMVSADGRFVPVAADQARHASCLVVGRRGLGSDPDARGLGGNVEPILRRVDSVVCLAPKLHLPGRRALILYDERHPNQGFADFLASHPALDGLSFDIATIAPDEDAAPETGRTRVERISGAAEPTPDCAERTLVEYFSGHRCDIIVAPRSVLLDPAGDRQALTDALAGWRVPMLFPPRVVS